MKYTAKAISIVFHPLLMQLLILFLFFQTPSYLSFISQDLRTLFYIFFALATFIIPATALPLLVNMRLISSYTMESPKERLLPLLFTAFAYFITFYLLTRFPVNVPSIIKFLPLAASLTLVIAAIISKYWKISLHMIGTGGATGALIALNMLFASNVLPQIIFIIIISGFVGTARLALNAHNAPQIYFGYITGLVGVFSVLYVTC